MLIKVFSSVGILSESTLYLLGNIFRMIIELIKNNSLLILMLTSLIILILLMFYLKKKQDETPRIQLNCLRELNQGDKFDLNFNLINGKEDVSVRIWGFLVDRKESYSHKCPAPHGAIYKLDLEKYEQRKIKIKMKIPENFNLGKYSIISCCEVTIEDFKDGKIFSDRRRVKGIIKHIDVVPKVSINRIKLKGFKDIINKMMGKSSKLSSDLALRLVEQKDFNLDKMKEIELNRTKLELKLKLRRYKRINKLTEKKREIDSEINLIRKEAAIKKEIADIDYYQKIQEEKNKRIRKLFNLFKEKLNKIEVKKLLKQKNKLDKKIRRYSN